MQPTDKEELKKVAFTFLKQQKNAVISTVSPQMTPEAANVLYSMDDDWTIYIVSHEDSRKVSNIRANPKVALVVGTTLVAHTAQIEATAEILDESQASYSAITQKFQQNKTAGIDPIFGVSKGRYVILKIHIDWLRWLYFEQMTNKEIYTVLIP